MSAGCAPDAAEHQRKGESYLWVKNYAAAINEFKMSSEKNPEEFTVWYHLGLSYMNVSRFAEAIAAFNRALDLNAQDINCYNNMAVCYNYLDQRADAEWMYSRVLELNPTSVSGLYNLAIHHLAGKDLERTESYLERLESALKVQKKSDIETADIRYALDSLKAMSRIER